MHLLLRGNRGSGQTHGETGAFAQGRVYRNSTFHFLNGFLHNIQPQSRTALLLAGTIKHVEYFIDMLFSNAQPVVAYLQCNFLLRGKNGYPDHARTTMHTAVFIGIAN